MAMTPQTSTHGNEMRHPQHLQSAPGAPGVRSGDHNAIIARGPNGARIVTGYMLQERLGHGSFASVYKGIRVEGPTMTAATDVPPPGVEVVAVKVITRNEKLSKKVLENLEVEISILRNYRHSNVVGLYSVQKTAEHFYLMLEFCGGGDLQQLIRSRKHGRLSERLTRRLMRDLTLGLRFLYEKQLIHRDIKPQNLLLTGPLPLDETDDECRNQSDEWARRKANFPSHMFSLKIADFGFARHLQTTSLAETLCGSPLYMAPEILQHQRYDAKADLWSAGTVLFEMISGRPPFHGENHIDLLRNIHRCAVKLPPGVKVSPECVNLLRILLNRNPLSRAGFEQFFKASDTFVNLGCNGQPCTGSSNMGTTTKSKGPLDRIAEDSNENNDAVPFSERVADDTMQQDRVTQNQGHRYTQQQAQSPQQAYPQQQVLSPQPVCHEQVPPSQQVYQEQVHSPHQGLARGHSPLQKPSHYPRHQEHPMQQSQTSYHHDLPKQQGAVPLGGSPQKQGVPQQQTEVHQHQQKYLGEHRGMNRGSNTQQVNAGAQGSLPVQNPVGVPHVASASHQHARIPIQDEFSHTSSRVAANAKLKVEGLVNSHVDKNTSTAGQSKKMSDAQKSNEQRMTSKKNKSLRSQFAPLVPSPPGPVAFKHSGVSPSLPPALSLDSTAKGGFLPPSQASVPASRGSLTPVSENPLLQQPHGAAYQFAVPSNSSSLNSTPDNDEFVMVEHTIQTPSMPSSQMTSRNVVGQSRRSFSSSVRNVFSAAPSLYNPRRVDVDTRNATASGHPSAPSHYPGMLSTSPGTGGALMGAMMERGCAAGVNTRGSIERSSPADKFVRVGSDSNSGQQGSLELIAKMLAAAEDVGRRAVHVAHLGDTRAYLAMRIMCSMKDSSMLSSSLSPMEGVIEENEEDLSDDGAPHNMAPHGRRSPTSARVMDESEENDEMPFALAPDDSNEFSCSATDDDDGSASQVPPQPSTHDASRRTEASPTALINAHFQEALSCYLKALPLMKGAVIAAQRVADAIGKSSSKRTKSTENESDDEGAALGKRCDLSLKWLAAQFSGVLERADAASAEVAKVSSQLRTMNEKEVEIVSVEELVYNHSLACGRDGAVKQLLGQYNAARTCYRSAGLLAETLLMEPRLGADDRKILEGYVSGFAERIREVDRILHLGIGQKSAGVVGLVGSPVPSRSLRIEPMR